MNAPYHVSFHLGRLKEKSEIQEAFLEGGHWCIAARVTPFHPQDPLWPDQPDDRGWALDAGGRELAIEGASVRRWAPEVGHWQVVRQGDSRKEMKGATIAIFHHVRAERAFAVGEPIEIRVDPALRGDLSAAHTASHLQALALNRALTESGLHVARRDTLGALDFDGELIVSSTITPLRTLESYDLGPLAAPERARLGDRAFLEELRTQIVETLRGWREFLLAQNASLEVTPTRECAWSQRRAFRLALPRGLKAETPCGGTHSLELYLRAAHRLEIELQGERTLVVRNNLIAPEDEQ
jgi:alanyl-tRNA synthetase